VNRDLVHALERMGCTNVIYLTNPVDMQLFDAPTEVRDGIVAEWNGNSQHRVRNEPELDIKGWRTIVAPALAQTGTAAVVADYNAGRLQHEDMPGFYRQANVALCASLFEGASNSVMEAMASGLAVVTTDSGNAIEMHESELAHLGASGIIVVERSVQAFVDALEWLRALGPDRVLQMGRLNRNEIQARWSWEVWADGYGEFLDMAT
jgi:glycosyltransferase involved in cell wall biosynthesis